MLFLFAVCAVFPNIVFAQSIARTNSGVGVVTPGAIIIPVVIIVFDRKTMDSNGKFSLKVKEGEYTLNLFYNELIKFEIIEHRPGGDAFTNNESYEFTFTLDEKSMVLLKDCVEKRMHKPFVITKEFSKASPQFIVPKGEGTISGKLTYTKAK